MPIVINPYRDKGKMDINIEDYLTRSRLLANIVSIKNYHKKVYAKSEIEIIELGIDERKYNEYKFLKSANERYSNEFRIEFREKILKPLYAKMFTYKVNRETKFFEYPNFNSLDDGLIKEIAENYLVKKIISIPIKYKAFEKYDYRKDKENDIKDNFLFDNDLDSFITDLYSDRSHITLKIRQTLNFLRKNIFGISNSIAKGILDFENTLPQIERILGEFHFTKIEDYVPPPFLVCNIIFKDGSNFGDLSSGEKQEIFSLNSIIYHLKNIESVHKSVHKKNVLLYDTINIFFDEIELYFHPDFQKSFISKLLLLIKEADYKIIKSLNMLFLTHSPFILSDIPKQNILYLKSEEFEIQDKKIQFSIPQTSKDKKSFGANITDLLADSFFIEDGLIGDFAKEKINKTLNWLRIKINDFNQNSDLDINTNIEYSEYELTNEYNKKIISLIDEPLVKYQLNEMYLKYVNDEDYISKEIERLQSLLKP